MASRNPVNALLGAIALLLLLGGSGCGDEGKYAAITGHLGDEGLTENRVTGSVGDGPIVGARLRVFSKSGELLMEADSSSTADYDITIKTQGKNYPLTLVADQGIDLVTGAPPDFSLLTAIVRPNTRSFINLNPYTTLIFGAARNSGEISNSTVAAASDAVVTRYGFGFDSQFIGDPITTPIDDGNVHLIVKTSETLGEMIRRTRDAINATGANIDADAVVAALAADLSTDGWIDGAGASGHDARIAAVANVASAAVLVEAMANRLHVYGVDATQAMDQAIRQVRPTAPATSTTANVAVPAEAFEQAARTLQATQVVSGDPLIADAIDVMLAAEAGSLPATLAPQLPGSLDTVLANALLAVAYASDDQLAEVNAIASGQGSTPPPDEDPEPPPEEPEPPPEEPEPPPEEPPTDPEPPPNNPPVISGTPDTTAVVGEAWEFQPTASDPDGDTLSFSISNKPAWLKFDTATGRTWGTPADTDVGTHMQITISVSDGQDTASLAPFDLAVKAPTLGSTTLSWTPPTEYQDGSPLTDLQGYKIYYGNSTTQLDQVLNIKNTGQKSHVVENLAVGTWYFGVTAYDGAGRESTKSNIASKTIM
jgi:hypothetical protein